MSGLKEIMEFPCLHTFKIIGKNNEIFINEVLAIFNEVDIPEPKLSRDNTFISYSVTTLVENYETLESLYKKISFIKDLKFYL